MFCCFTWRNALSIFLLCCALSGCSHASYLFQSPGRIPQKIAATSCSKPVVTVLLAHTSVSVPEGPHQVRSGTTYRVRRHASQLNRTGPKPSKAKWIRLSHREHAQLKGGDSTQRILLLGIPEPVRQRNRGTALLLALLLGGFGVHLAYLGYHGRAAAYLFVLLLGLNLAILGALGSIGGGGMSTLVVLGIILTETPVALSLVDAVRIAINNLQPKNSDYKPEFL